MKRCKGLPGEVLALRGDTLFVNRVGIKFKEPTTVSYHYLIKKNTKALLDSVGTSFIDENRFFLSDYKHDIYKIHPDIVHELSYKISAVIDVAPYLDKGVDQFREIVIPSKVWS